MGNVLKVGNNLKIIELPFEGVSMNGLIQEGDRIEVRLNAHPQKLCKLSFGKIVLTKQGQEWTVHRVVRNQDSYCTKGDASLNFDDLSHQFVWGEVVSLQSSRGRLEWPFTNRYYGTLIAWLSCRYNTNRSRYYKAILRRGINYLGLLARRYTVRKNRLDKFLSLMQGRPTDLFDTEINEVKRLAGDHFLSSYLYRKLSKQNEPQFLDWKNKRRVDTLRSAVMVTETSSLGESLPSSMKVCLLKGMSLLFRIYQDIGSRSMSDVDLLVAPKDECHLKELLQERGYRQTTEDHGPANKSKSMWINSVSGVEIVIEIHTKLFWFQPPGFEWRFKASEIKGFDQLTLIDEIIYLCIHLAYCHNFQRLFWLTDIYEILLQSRGSIDWSDFRQRAKLLGASKAVASVLYGMGQIFDYKVRPWPLEKQYPILKLLISRNFLVNPYGSLLKYVLLKHLLQDKLINALKYDYYRVMISVNQNWKKS